MSRLPLEGMHVVEFGQIIAGPTAGLIRGDMGADVVKVEPTDAGTPSRPNNQRNGSFFYFNRNKRAVAVDLVTPEGHDMALRRMKAASIVFQCGIMRPQSREGTPVKSCWSWATRQRKRTTSHAKPSCAARAFLMKASAIN
jgi:crotonobetainyl-CoA:carnitine CoA-transferase CaiB-like acyl-CoA transferase